MSRVVSSGINFFTDNDVSCDNRLTISTRRLGTDSDSRTNLSECCNSASWQILSEKDIPQTLPTNRATLILTSVTVSFDKSEMTRSVASVNAVDGFRPELTEAKNNDR